MSSTAHMALLYRAVPWPGGSFALQDAKQWKRLDHGQGTMAEKQHGIMYEGCDCQSVLCFDKVCAACDSLPAEGSSNERACGLLACKRSRA